MVDYLPGLIGKHHILLLPTFSLLTTYPRDLGQSLFDSKEYAHYLKAIKRPDATGQVKASILNVPI